MRTLGRQGPIASSPLGICRLLVGHSALDGNSSQNKNGKHIRKMKNTFCNLVGAFLPLSGTTIESFCFLPLQWRTSTGPAQRQGAVMKHQRSWYSCGTGLHFRRICCGPWEGVLTKGLCLGRLVGSHKAPPTVGRWWDRARGVWRAAVTMLTVSSGPPPGPSPGRL